MTTTARDEMQSIGAVVVAGSTGKVGQILLQPRSGGIGKVGTEVPGKRKWRNQQLSSPFLRYPRLPYG